VKKYSDGQKEIQAELAQLKKHCAVIRVLAHTQVIAGSGTGVRVKF
jgi:large subunit ribosomal protein L3e